MEDKNKSIPNYDIPCKCCGAKPTVDIYKPDGSFKFHFEMCGVCVFGDKKLKEPESWV